MNTLSFRVIVTIVLSFIAALLLTIMPLPDWLQMYRPQWLPLVLIYWVIAIPQRIALFTAWLLGLVVDSLSGTLLGEHALALTVIAYLANHFHRQIRMFPLLQQSVVIFILIIIYQTLLLWIQGVIGQLDHNYWFWVSAFVSVLFWPWIFMLLKARSTQSRQF